MLHVRHKTMRALNRVARTESHSLDFKNALHNFPRVNLQSRKTIVLVKSTQHFGHQQLGRFDCSSTYGTNFVLAEWVQGSQKHHDSEEDIFFTLTVASCQLYCICMSWQVRKDKESKPAPCGIPYSVSRWHILCNQKNRVSTHFCADPKP